MLLALLLSETEPRRSAAIGGVFVGACAGCFPFSPSKLTFERRLRPEEFRCPSAKLPSRQTSGHERDDAPRIEALPGGINANVPRATAHNE